MISHQKPLGPPRPFPDFGDQQAEIFTIPLCFVKHSSYHSNLPNSLLAYAPLRSAPMSSGSDSAETANPQPPRGALLAVFLVVLVDMLGFGLVVPLLPIYARQFQASAPQVTLLFSIFSVCQFFATPFLGAWSDRVGRRPILSLSLIGSALSYVLLAWATQHGWTNLAMGLMVLYLSRVIAGLTAGNISAAQAYISDVTTPSQRAKGMGILGAAFGIGFSIGPAAGGILAYKLGASAPAWFSAGLSLGAAVLCWVLLKEARSHVAASAGAFLNPRQFVPLFSNKPLMKVNAVWFIAMCAFVAVDSAIVMFLADVFLYQEKQIAYYFLLVGMVILVTQGALVGRLVRRYSEWSLTIFGIALNATGSLMTAATIWYPSPILLFGAAAVYAFGRSLFQPTISALASHSSNPEQQGLSFGFFQGVGTFARVVGPIGAGYLYAGHHGLPWILGSLTLLATSFWLMRLRHAEQRAVSSTAPSH